MEGQRYPEMIIDHAAIRANAGKICGRCREAGIKVAGIIKGTGGMVSVARDMIEGGAELIGSSRMEQLARCREAGIDVPLLMIRVPMLSEVPDLIRTADISLNSEMKVIEAINDEALRQRRKHKVILMADLGDLREGWYDRDELFEAALKVENDLTGVELAGVGTNLGCYGSVMPTEDKMRDLAETAERIEKAIGRKLEYVSGGATSSLLGVCRGYMPGEINMLRIGAGILTGPLEDVRVFYGLTEMDDLDVPFTMKAEVIEVKKKPTHPVGQLGVDAFGQKPEYVDRGVRRRALLAVGRADYGDIDDLIPTRDGIEIVGASGDHTIIDVEDAGSIAVGDIVEFRLRYSAVLRLSASENVYIVERS
jgi:predicted amino acid racemase